MYGNSDYEKVVNALKLWYITKEIFNEGMKIILLQNLYNVVLKHVVSCCKIPFLG